MSVPPNLLSNPFTVSPVSLIRFTADGIGQVVVLADGNPTIVTDGYGGWEVVDRTRRKGLVQYKGTSPLRMSIPVLFDGFIGEDSQEVAISKLSRMALPPAEWDEPPVVNVDGAIVPKPGPVDWVIENLQWGSNIIWDFSRDGVMSRLRQDCVVNLLQMIDEDRVSFTILPPATGVVSGGSSSGWPKQYITKPGDTLLTIAAKFYKDSSKWRIIGDANNIRDPKAVTAYITLTIPKPT